MTPLSRRYDERLLEQLIYCPTVTTADLDRLDGCAMDRRR